MIAFLVICYSVFYWLLFIKLRLLEKNARNISVFVGVGVALIGSIVFMWLTFAPTTKDGQMFQYVVQIVPNVKGQVVEVPAAACRANRPAARASRPRTRPGAGRSPPRPASPGARPGRSAPRGRSPAGYRSPRC